MNMWQITYLGPAVTVQCPKKMFSLSNCRCQPRSKFGNIGRSCPVCHGRSSQSLLKWSLGAKLDIANLKGCSLLIITVPWPLHERLWYSIPLQKSTLALLLIKKCRKFIFLQFADYGSWSTSGFWKAAKWLTDFSNWTATAGPKCAIFPILKQK